MSDRKWVHKSFPSEVGAVAAGCSATLGFAVIPFVVWALHLEAWVAVYWALLVALIATARATYREWQSTP